MNWLSVTNDHGYVPPVEYTFRSFPQSWIITGFVTRVRTGATSGARTATSQEHLNSFPIFSGARVTRILVLCVMLCRSLFVLFLLTIVLSSIYGFWLPLWYLHTLLIDLANWRYDIKKHYIIHRFLANRNYIPAAKMAAADHSAFNSPRESQIIIIIVLFPECLSKHLTFLH